MTVKANQRTLHRQIKTQFEGNRHILGLATDHEIGHGRDIPWTPQAKEAPDPIREDWVGRSWIVAVVTTERGDGKPFNARHLLLTSIRTIPEALLRLVRDRWSIEGWHWIRDTQLHEAAHRYRGHGAGVRGSLRTAALNLLRLGGLESIRSGRQRVSRDITAMLGMAGREPEPTAC